MYRILTYKIPYRPRFKIHCPPPLVLLYLIVSEKNCVNEHHAFLSAALNTKLRGRLFLVGVFL